MLQKFGMRDCALAWGPGKGRVPAWLQKWVALCLEYVELERTLLPAQLLAIPPPLGNFTAETAASQAKGTPCQLAMIFHPTAAFVAKGLHMLWRHMWTSEAADVPSFCTLAEGIDIVLTSFWDNFVAATSSMATAGPYCS